MKKRFFVTAVLAVVMVLATVIPAFAGVVPGGGSARPVEGKVYKISMLKNTGVDFGKTYLRSYGGRFGFVTSYSDPYYSYSFTNFWYCNPDYKNPQQMSFDDSQIEVVRVTKMSGAAVQFYYVDGAVSWPNKVVITTGLTTVLWGPYPWA